jgi:hypothetical protein
MHIYALCTCDENNGYAMELDKKVFRWRAETPTMTLLLIISVLVTWTFFGWFTKV